MARSPSWSSASDPPSTPRLRTAPPFLASTSPLLVRTMPRAPLPTSMAPTTTDDRSGKRLNGTRVKYDVDLELGLRTAPLNTVPIICVTWRVRTRTACICTSPVMKQTVITRRIRVSGTCAGVGVGVGARYNEHVCFNPLFTGPSIHRLLRVSSPIQTSVLLLQLAQQHPPRPPRQQLPQL